MRKDGRAAFAQIAAKLKVSPGMIRQRYNRLVDMGMLKVVAISNPLQRGFKTMALIGFALMAIRCWMSRSKFQIEGSSLSGDGERALRYHG